MKKILLLTLVVCLALVIAACSNNNDNQAGGTQPAGNQAAGQTDFERLSTIESGASLRLAWWGSQTRHDMTMEMIDIFEELSGISIDFEFYSWDDYHVTMLTQAAANMLPCVMQQTHGQVSNFVPTGLTMNLDPWIQAGVLDLSDYDPGLLLWGQYQGRQYFIPTGLGFQAIMINTDLVEAAGVEIHIPYTWEDKIEWGIQIHQATGAYMADHFGHIVFTEYTPDGLPMFTTDENRDWNIPQSTIEYVFGATRRAIDLGIAIPTGHGRGDAIEESHFATGDAWSRPAPINATAGFFAAMGEDAPIKFIPGPTVGDARPHIFEATMCWAVTTQTDYPNAAVFLVDQLLHNIDIMSIMQVDRGMPGSARVREAISPQFNNVARLMNQAIDTMEAGGTLGAWGGLTSPAWRPAVQSVIVEHQEMVRYTDMSVADIAASLVREAQQTIDRAR